MQKREPAANALFAAAQTIDRWEMTIMDGFRDDGKRRLKTFFGKTQKEVKTKAKGYRDAKDSGLLLDVNYLLPEWADILCENHSPGQAHRRGLHGRTVPQSGKKKRLVKNEPLTS